VHGATTRRLDDERGTSVIELVLVTVMVVTGMLMLLALTQMVILRQHALVAARFGAFYERVAGEQPSTDVVQKAVGARGSWRTGSGDEADSDPASTLDSGDAITNTLFNAVVTALTRVGTRETTATGDVPATVLPRYFGARTVAAHYVLPGSTWTDDRCGSFIAHLSAAVNLGPFEQLLR
jgi:hypothetical protein